MKRKTLISESELNSKICNSVKKILSERRGMTSWEAAEFKAQKQKDDALRKKIAAQKAAEQGVAPKRKKAKVKKVSEKQAFIERLKSIFFDQGKNIGDTNIVGKLIQQLDRGLNTANDKKGAGGCYTNQRHSEEKKDEFEEYNHWASVFYDYMSSIKYYLRQNNPQEYLSDKLLYLLKDLQTTMVSVANGLLETPQLKVRNNFNDGTGGHYVGFRKTLKDILRCAARGMFNELFDECVRVTGINPKSFVAENKEYIKNTDMEKRISLTESDLHRIIKESVNRVLNETTSRQLYGDDEKYYISPGDSDWREQESDISGFNDSDGPIDYTYDDFSDMAGKIGWDKLESMISNNRNFKKWYDKLQKKGENQWSWDAFDNYNKYKKDQYEDQMDNGLGDLDANMNVHDSDDFGYNSRYDNPYWNN